MGNCQQKNTTRHEVLTEEIIPRSDTRPDAQQDFQKESYKYANQNFGRDFDLRGTGILSKSIYVGQYYPLIHIPETQNHDKQVRSCNRIEGEEEKYIIEYTDGSRYEGELDRITQKPHGNGTFYHANGDAYTGRFHDGLAHGKGTYRYNDNSTYIGGFIADQKHGFGEENYGNGQIYKGYFENGVKNGRGRYEWGSEAFYDGDIHKNRKHGLGMLVISGVEAYTGDWHDDLRHGQGKIQYANGDMFEGSFSNNLKEGKGLLRTSEGIYEGWFANDVRHGKGLEIDSKTLQQTPVDYVNGVKT